MVSNLDGKLEKILKSLTKREEEVIRLRYGLGGEIPHTLQAIGNKLNITRERVRQIEERILRRFGSKELIAALKELKKPLMRGRIKYFTIQNKLKKYGDILAAKERKQIETKLEKLKKALIKKDKKLINTAIKELEEAAKPLLKAKRVKV
ncbi:MAG: sigma factor-like helix-turn-helix DNA-binding protein [candidate division WOR-3 bacterium]|uniref:RNA polymerase sigma-70 region 4 domain-containing protein n=1 Tax=candidate division WOR-3 bacterium TaxID=2052148 RepID=A0A7C4S114_UNCW3